MGGRKHCTLLELWLRRSRKVMILTRAFFSLFQIWFVKRIWCDFKLLLQPWTVRLFIYTLSQSSDWTTFHCTALHFLLVLYSSHSIRCISAYPNLRFSQTTVPQHKRMWYFKQQCLWYDTVQRICGSTRSMILYHLYAQSWRYMIGMFS